MTTPGLGVVLRGNGRTASTISERAEGTAVTTGCLFAGFFAGVELCFVFVSFAAVLAGAETVFFSATFSDFAATAAFFAGALVSTFVVAAFFAAAVADVLFLL